MKFFEWNTDKNAWLKKVRGITFNDIMYHIERGDLLDVLQHSNPKKYPDQKIFVVNVDGYAFLVPFVESKEALFLKTVIPSRKMTKVYLRENKK